MFLPNSNLKVFRRPCFNLQPAPSPVRRERAGERVVLRIARIWFYLNLRNHPRPNLPPPRGKGRVAVAATSSVGFAHEMNAKMKTHSVIV